MTCTSIRDASIWLENAFMLLWIAATSSVMLPELSTTNTMSARPCIFSACCTTARQAAPLSAAPPPGLIGIHVVPLSDPADEVPTGAPGAELVAVAGG